MCVFKGFAGDFCGVSTHLAGRFDFLKSPKSNPSLKEGLLDFSKSPRSNPPLREGRLDFLKSPRSKGGGPGTGGRVLQSDVRIRKDKVEKYLERTTR